MRLAYGLAAVFALDRLLKLAAVAHFFGKPHPAPPSPWPTITLVQPITAGASNLSAALQARARLDYPAHIQHLFVCDRGDNSTQAICRNWLDKHPYLDARIVEVDWREGNGVAPKTVKLQSGLAEAQGDVVCCVDDDIMLRPDALRVMLPYLYEPGAGVVFGLACYTEWSNVPSGLMSAFVNANALLTYIPAVYLTEPFTVTGHIFALRRETLEQVGGFAGLERNAGDDHEIARRVRNLGLRAVQTPMVYDVENRFATFAEYAAQMKRWFVFPRQMLLPMMTQREQAITTLGSAANVIPSVLALQAVLTRRRPALTALAFTLALFCAVYALCERLYLHRATPLKRWALVPVVALLSPAQIIGALLSNNEVQWRGKRLVIERGGEFVERET